MAADGVGDPRIGEGHVAVEHITEHAPYRYLSRFYNEARGDVILNPFDARSATWDILAELNTEYAADNLAKALIPGGVGDKDA